MAIPVTGPGLLQNYRGITALRGEEVIILANDELGEREIQVVAMPPRAETVKPQFGSAKGLIEVHDDFDDPLEEFEDYP